MCAPYTSTTGTARYLAERDSVTAGRFRLIFVRASRRIRLSPEAHTKTSGSTTMAESDKCEASSTDSSSKVPAQSTTPDSPSTLTEGVAGAISADRTTPTRIVSNAGASTPASTVQANSDQGEFTVSSAISADRVASIEAASSAKATVVRPTASAAPKASTGASKTAAEG